MDPYSRRIDLAGSDERLIGAAARRESRRRLGWSLFGAALVLTAVVVYFKLRPDRPVPEDGRRRVVVRCAACGFSGATRVPVESIFPVECPRCSKPSAAEAWQCRSCRAVFVPPSLNETVRCPTCRTDNVGTATAPAGP